MEIERLKTSYVENEYGQKTYVIADGKTAVVIDAGADIASIKEALGGLKPSAVFITHCHFDHILHIGDYAREFDCPIYLHNAGEAFLSDASLNASEQFGCAQIFSAKNVKKLSGGEAFTFGEIVVKTIRTPGHSRDGMCFLVGASNKLPILFSGDTVFARAVGRADLPTGSERDLISSLEKLLNLNFGDVFAGHNQKSNKKEQEHNISVWLKRLKENLLRKEEN